MRGIARIPLTALLVATLALAGCAGDDETAETTEAEPDDNTVVDEDVAPPTVVPAGNLVPGTAQLGLSDGTTYDLVIDGDCDEVSETSVFFAAIDDLLTVSIDVTRSTGRLLASGVLEAEGRVDQVAVESTNLVSLSGVVTVADDTAELQEFHLEANCNHPES